jgi:hypothetical protein
MSGLGDINAVVSIKICGRRVLFSLKMEEFRDIMNSVLSTPLSGPFKISGKGCDSLMHKVLMNILSGLSGGA